MSVETAMLLVEEGPQMAPRIVLDQPQLVIGRQDGCDLVIPERQVSRRHACIRQQGDAFMIEDLGSKNGTFVNGQELTSPRLLKDGDEIQIALCCKFRFVGEGSTAPLQRDERPRGLRLDLEGKQVWVAGRVLDPPLSLAQYRLLELLYKEPQRVRSRDQIVEAVWPEDDRDGISEQAIDALARRLRDRLAELDPEHPYVITVRGHGFRLENVAG